MFLMMYQFSEHSVHRYDGLQELEDFMKIIFHYQQHQPLVLHIIDENKEITT